MLLCIPAWLECSASLFPSSLTLPTHRHHSLDSHDSLAWVSKLHSLGQRRRVPVTGCWNLSKDQPSTSGMANKHLSLTFLKAQTPRSKCGMSPQHHLELLYWLLGLTQGQESARGQET